MKASIVAIGNSQGIRLPKAVLLQAGLSGEVELHVAAKQVIIRAISHPRIGWEGAFKRMADHKDDRLLDTSATRSDWDKDEWEWT